MSAREKDLAAAGAVPLPGIETSRPPPASGSTEAAPKASSGAVLQVRALPADGR
jgi:hypothetical protein